MIHAKINTYLCFCDVGKAGYVLKTSILGFRSGSKMWFLQILLEVRD